MASHNTNPSPIIFDAPNILPKKSPKTLTVPAAHAVLNSVLPPFRSQIGNTLSKECSSLEFVTVSVGSNKKRVVLDCVTVSHATLVGQKVEEKHLGDDVSHSECAPTLKWAETMVSDTSSLKSFSGSDSLIFDEGDPITDTNHLRVPLNDKLWLVSPPGSPPIGWTSTLEHPPNSLAFPEDLTDALAECNADSFGLDKGFSSTSSIPRFPNTAFAFHKSRTPLEGGGDGNHPLIVIEDWSA